jgi:hypothetical protein
MPEAISNSKPKAKKEHQCELCRKTIKVGETYDDQFLKYEGETYHFKMHSICHEISSCLWSYIEPDEGIHDEDFKDGCQEYCYRFVCPMCVHWIDEDTCEDGNVYCLDKIATRLKEYGLKKEPGRYGMPHWVEFRRVE